MLNELLCEKAVLIAGNLFLFSGFLASFFQRKEELFRLGFLLALILWLALTVGARYRTVGIDTPKYVAAFESQHAPTYHALEIYEPLYILFGYVTHLILREYNLFLALITFLQAYLLLTAYRQLTPRFYPLATGLYAASFVFWLANLSMLRQGLTIALFFCAYAFWLNQKRKTALFLGLISPLIHFSAALIPLALTLFQGYRWLIKRHPKVFYSLFFLVIAGLIYPGPLFYHVLKFLVDQAYALTGHPYLEKIQWYMTWTKLTPWHVKHVYFLILSLAVFLAPLALKEEHLRPHFLFLLTGLTVILLSKYDEMVADRMFMYFVPSIPVLLLSLVEILFPGEKDQLLVLTVILLGGLVWFNVKFFLLQYPGWFISPYPAVR